MSWEEYNSTGGFLRDRNSSGEGPNVTADINYLLKAKFTKNSEKYNVIVQYQSVLTKNALSSTPFLYVAGQDGVSPIFNAARSTGMWYKKIEGKRGVAFGFPGNSTSIFNSSLIAPPIILKTIN